MRIISLLWRLWPDKPGPSKLCTPFKIPSLWTDFWAVSGATEKQALQNVHEKGLNLSVHINKVILKSIRKHKWFHGGKAAYCIPCLSNLFQPYFHLSNPLLLVVVHVNLMRKADSRRCFELKKKSITLFSKSGVGSSHRSSSQGFKAGNIQLLLMSTPK